MLYTDLIWLNVGEKAGCENATCEAEIKKDIKATTRCLPLDAKEESGKCIRCGSPSSRRWLFGLSY